MTPGKHFIQGISHPIVRGLRSLASQDSSLVLNEREKVLFRKQDSDKVLLLSGGGSGHEPAHAGYVGDGMLDICVAGEIFASPSATQVLAGLRALPSPKGILMIVKNYTGDRLNFGLGAEKAKALGIQVNVVFVGDDVSVEVNELVGRRGLAGVVFVHKVAGAVARAGGTLEEVTEAAQNAANQLYTAAVSLDRCDVPNRETTNSLPPQELEYGMGIHNEPGVRRAAIPELSITVSNLIEMLNRSSLLANQTRIAVMINNLGGLSVLELHIVADEVSRQLQASGLAVRRVVVGTFVTSLNAPGFSVTLLQLSDETEKYVNEDTAVHTWPNFTSVPSIDAEGTSVGKLEPKTNGVARTSSKPIITVPSRLVQEIVTSILERVTSDEPQITHYDTIAGDGDCGETLLKGVQAVAAALKPHLTTETVDICLVFSVLATSIESSMGGTSGAIYAIFFNALSNSLNTVITTSSASNAPIAPVVSESVTSALSQLYRYTTARKGHKTLMDALIPFVEAFNESQDLSAGVKAASKGAQSTRTLRAVLGRASYVGDEAFDVEGGVPDPGALGVVSILKGFERVVGR